jgi:hypothetical protein
VLNADDLRRATPEVAQNLEGLFTKPLGTHTQLRLPSAGPLDVELALMNRAPDSQRTVPFFMRFMTLSTFAALQSRDPKRIAQAVILHSTLTQRLGPGPHASYLADVKHALAQGGLAVSAQVKPGKSV